MSERMADRQTWWAKAKERSGEKGDEGFFAPFMLAKGVGGIAMRAIHLVGWRTVAMTSAGALVGGMLGAGAMLSEAKFEDHADLEQADTKIEAKLLEFDTTHKIQIARTYFDVQMRAEHIQKGIIIDTPRFDIVPDIGYEANTEMSAIGVIIYEVPFTAITQSLNHTTNKIDIYIDPSKLSQTRFWRGSGPSFRDYTLDDNKRNYGDQKGFRDSIIHMYADELRVFNADTLGNKLTTIDDKVRHDMSIKGLEAFSSACTGEIDNALRRQVLDAVNELIKTMGRSNDIGTIMFFSGTSRWSVDDGPASIPKMTDDMVLKYGEFDVDSVTCEVDPASLDMEAQS